MLQTAGRTEKRTALSSPLSWVDKNGSDTISKTSTRRTRVLYVVQYAMHSRYKKRCPGVSPPRSFAPQGPRSFASEKIFKQPGSYKTVDVHICMVLTSLFT